MPVLARAWQMLLKGLAEARQAPNPLQAAEMVLVRIAYAAELPTPAEIVESLQQTGRQTGEAPMQTPAPKPDAPGLAPAQSLAAVPMRTGASISKTSSCFQSVQLAFPMRWPGPPLSTTRRPHS